MNNIVLKNFINIYQNNSFSEIKKDISYEELEKIEKNLRKFLFEENSSLTRRDKRRISNIKNNILFLMSFSSKHILKEMFKKDDFFKFRSLEKQNNGFYEDVFGKLGERNWKTELEELFFIEINNDVFNDNFFAPYSFLLKNDIQISNNTEEIKKYYFNMFKDIFVLRNVLIHNNDSKGLESFSLISSLISLFLIGGFFSNFIFSNINNDYKNLINNDNEDLLILNYIKNSINSFTNQNKSKRNEIIFVRYDKKYFDNLIVELERQFNFNEYSSLLEKKSINNLNTLTNFERWKLNQLRSSYIKFFISLISFNDNLKDILLEKTKLFKIIPKKNDKKTWDELSINSLIKNHENWKKKYEGDLKKLEIYFKGVKHLGIYIKDIIHIKKNGKPKEEIWNFTDIYSYILFELDSLLKDFKKLKPSDWFEFENEDFYLKNFKYKNDETLENYKAIHRENTILLLKRLIHNIKIAIKKIATKRYLFVEEDSEEKIKEIKILNKNNIKKIQDIKDRINLVLEKNQIFLNDDDKNKLQNFKNDLINFKKNNKSLFNKKIEEIAINNGLKYDHPKKLDIQFVESKKLRDFYKIKDLFQYIKTENLSKYLFIYYGSILNKNINKQTITMEDIDFLLSKRAIQKTEKYFFYNKKYYEVIYDFSNEDKINFFRENIFNKILKANSREDYFNKFKKIYDSKKLKFSEENVIILIYNWYINFTKNNNNFNKDELKEKLENKFIKLLNKQQKSKEIIFYSYLKINSVDFTNTRTYKTSIFSLLEGNKKEENLEKLKDLLPNFKSQIKYDFEKNKYVFNSEFNFQTYIENNFSIIQRNFKKNNEFIKDKLISEESYIDRQFSIKYKIKSKKKFDLFKNFSDIKFDTKKKYLSLNKNQYYKILNFFRENNVGEEYPLIYHEFESQKNTKRNRIDFKKILLNKSNFSVLLEHKYFDKVYRKVKNSDLIVDDYSKYLNNEKILHENNIYYANAIPNTFIEIQKLFFKIEKDKLNKMSKIDLKNIMIKKKIIFKENIGKKEAIKKILS